ncbi:MAG: class I tRNA ligase family protein, partial [Candidatus Moranbacteria bacterium]|nr:class I tRNA ligase family protein [Candidatus Moranbacteria bacterium]
MEKYIPSEIEKKWQKYWDENGTYKNYSREKKFYALDMFPYPSGVGLHVGHPKGYIATDVVSRFKMLNGYSVLHPMGWDAFGLPAENYAIKNKTNPNIFTAKSVANYKKQLEMFGFTYDWDREINTTDPQYYKWTQWIFLKLFEKGLAYESNAPINWCPSCKTGLSNEDLEDGKCERCGSEVEQKPMRQWVLKMTEYADRLLYDLDSPELDWEDMIVEQQKNWIGRSEGVQFEMKIKDSEEKIEVYTTRIDTAFGITYAVVAPEHPIIEKLKEKISNYVEVAQYVAD